MKKIILLAIFVLCGCNDLPINYCANPTYVGEVDSGGSDQHLYKCGDGHYITRSRLLNTKVKQ